MSKWSEIVLLAYVFLSTAKGCKELWSLSTSESLLEFTNQTIIGKYEIVKWSWEGTSGGRWTLQLQKSLSLKELNGIKGLLTYTKNGANMSLKWKKGENKLQWKLSQGSPLEEKDWSFRANNLGEIKFETVGGDHWSIVIDNVRISREGVATLRDEEIVVLREKRQLDETSQEIQLNTTTCTKNWGQIIYDFFFGEGDRARGEPDGLFVRAFRWMKKVSCRVMGTCTPPGDSVGQPVEPSMVANEEPNPQQSTTPFPSENDIP